MSPLKTEERIDVLVRLAEGDERRAFAEMLAERDNYRRRAIAAEAALKDWREQAARIEREWRATAIAINRPDGASAASGDPVARETTPPTAELEQGRRTP